MSLSYPNLTLPKHMLTDNKVTNATRIQRHTCMSGRNRRMRTWRYRCF